MTLIVTDPVGRWCGDRACRWVRGAGFGLTVGFVGRWVVVTQSVTFAKGAEERDGDTARGYHIG